MELNYIYKKTTTLLNPFKTLYKIDGITINYSNRIIN